MKTLISSFVLLLITAAPVAAQSVPENATRVQWGRGWVCNSGFIDRDSACVSLGVATDAEIRRYLIAQSIRSYSGSCACPYNRDRGGRRCGGRSAYSRGGGASPICYARDISDEQVALVRRMYSDRNHKSP